MAKSKKKNAKIDFEEITIHEENKLIILFLRLLECHTSEKFLKNNKKNK